MNNQEINNKLDQLQTELDTIKESLTLNDTNILSLIVTKDEKIKELEHTISIQKITLDTQFSISNPQNIPLIAVDKLLEQVKNDMKQYEIKDYFHNPDPFDRNLFPSASDLGKIIPEELRIDRAKFGYPNNKQITPYVCPLRFYEGEYYD